MESCRFRLLQNSRLRSRTDVAELSNLAMAQSGRRSWLQGAAVVEMALVGLKEDRSRPACQSRQLGIHCGLTASFSVFGREEVPHFGVAGFQKLETTPI